MKTFEVRGLSLFLLFAAAPAILFLPFPFLDHVVFFGNTDALFYTNLLKLVADRMAAGDINPRWLAAANIGTGSAAPYYYPSLAYVITAALTAPMAYFDPDASFRLLGGMYLSQVASGLTAWWWLRSHFEHRAALLGALLFVLLPYKFIYIYLHFNLAQLWALVWLPMTMIACDGIVAGRVRAIPAFALAVALLASTHPLTLLAFGAIPVAYVLWFGRPRLGRSVVYLALGSLLGAGLASVYLLPMALTLDWVQRDSFVGGKYLALNNLNHRDLLFFLLYLAIAAITHAVLRRMPGATRGEREGFLFWSAVVLLSTVMLLNVSAPVWTHVAPLQYLQFPAARLHAGALLGTVWLASLYASRHGPAQPLPEFTRPPIFWMVAAAGLLLSGVAIEREFAGAHTLTRSYLDEMHALLILPPREYVPRQSSLDVITLYDARARLEAMPEAEIVQGQGTVQVTAWQARQIALRAEVDSASAVVRIRQVYLPAWQGRVLDDASRAPVVVEAKPPEGLLVFTLPRGVHSVALSLAPFPGERLGVWITMLSAVAMLIVYGWGNWSHRRRRSDLVASY